MVTEVGGAGGSSRAACVGLGAGVFALGLLACERRTPPFEGEPNLVRPGVEQATELAAGDFDGDGAIGVAMLSGRSGKFALLRSAGVAGKDELAAVEAGATATGAVLGDFDSDGRVDAAVAHHDTDEIWILRGSGGWSFEAPRVVRVPAAKPHAHDLDAADFDGDGRLDLLIAQSEENRAWVFLADGAGGFSAAPGSPIATGRHPYVLATGDFDRDGSMDFATPDVADKTVSVFLGDGKGGFRAAPGSPIRGFASPAALAAGDLTGDGIADLVVGNDGSVLQVLAGDGEGGFERGRIADLVPPEPCFGPLVADLDGDGALDVVATSTDGARTFSYWINGGHGKFGEPVPLPFPSGANAILVADLDGDGMPDLAAGSDRAPEIRVWLGRREAR